MASGSIVHAWIAITIMHAVVGKASYKPHYISSVLFLLLAAAIRSAPMTKADKMKAATNTAIIIIPVEEPQEDQQTADKYTNVCGKFVFLKIY